MTSKTFVIRLLKSVDHPLIARTYAQEQINVLKQYGVDGIASANQPWQTDPNTYMFIAVDGDTGEMVAGMRLDKETERKPIPMLEALSKLSEEFKDVVENLKPFGIAEGCGWWVKQEYAGLGLPGILLRAGISISPRLGIHYIFGFPHQHTRPIMAKFGFTAMDVIGEKGSFMYPDDRYNSTVVELNTQTLHTTPRQERERILALRKNPQLVTEQKGITLQYHLKLRKDFKRLMPHIDYKTAHQRANDYIRWGRTGVKLVLRGSRLLWR